MSHQRFRRGRSTSSRPYTPLQKALLGLEVKKDAVDLIGKVYFSSEEGQHVIDELDRVLGHMNETEREGCIRIMCGVSSGKMILPKSYYQRIMIPEDVYSSEEGFAGIWIGKSLEAKQRGEDVCIKVFQDQNSDILEKMKKEFYHAIIVWKQLRHLNLVPFLGILKDEKLGQLCFITPWYSNGDINNHIKNHNDANRLLLLAQAAYGLEHLHSHGIVHGSVNPGNILIDDNGNPRLGDFGIMRIMTHLGRGSRGKITSSVVRYIAPEFFPLGTKYPTKMSDIYSFAMTAYEVTTEIVPYYQQNKTSEIIRCVVEGHRPSFPQGELPWLPKEIRDMISRCWGENPEIRGEAQDARSELFREANNVVVADPGNQNGSGTPGRGSWIGSRLLRHRG